MTVGMLLFLRPAGPRGPVGRQFSFQLRAAGGKAAALPPGEGNAGDREKTVEGNVERWRHGLHEEHEEDDKANSEKYQSHGIRPIARANCPT